MEFMSVPDTYYNQLRENLKHSNVKISEDLDVLQVRTNLKSYFNRFGGQMQHEPHVYMFGQSNNYICVHNYHIYSEEHCLLR